MPRRRKKLGKLLVEEEVITENQLNEALKVQEETGGILGNILVEQGFVEVNVLLPLLARHYARLQFTLADCRISDDVVNLLPASLATKYVAMPIDADTHHVTVAMSNPMNDRAVQALATHLHRRVRPVMCTKQVLQKALTLHYGRAVSDEAFGGDTAYTFPQPPPHYTFESLVVGDANREAYQVTEVAGDFPGTTHNPLVICGDVGHGKTHMLCAIGNRARSRERSRRIAWLPAAELEHEVTLAIETGQVDAFHDKYHQVDILLLDDIQFLAERRGVQQEFGRLFGLLCSQGRQIAVSSDRPPQALSVLVEEVRTQFATGTVVRIGTTSVALKTAILMAKQKGITAKLSDQLLAELAKELPDDIRYLEGTLRNLNLRLSISGKEPTMEVLRRMLEDMGAITPKNRRDALAG
jgi:chromosomal replication initiator protein DnaA